MLDAQPEPATAASLGDVLGAVGRELTRLGQQASDLQDMLSTLGPPAGEGNAALYRLQELDRMTQALRGMAEFVGALVPTLSADWSCDPARASRNLTLSDLALRMSPCEAAAAPEKTDSGELELFDG